MAPSHLRNWWQSRQKSEWRGSWYDWSNWDGICRSNLSNSFSQYIIIINVEVRSWGNYVHSNRSKVALSSLLGVLLEKVLDFVFVWHLLNSAAAPPVWATTSRDVGPWVSLSVSFWVRVFIARVILKIPTSTKRHGTSRHHLPVVHTSPSSPLLILIDGIQGLA